MPLKQSVVLTAVLVLASACATAPHGPPSNSAAAEPVRFEADNLAEAYALGQGLVSFYNSGISRADRRRRNINLGIWAAGVYTAGAAGLRAHADNIFLGTLTGTSLTTLEPIVNTGGPEAWLKGLGETVCYMRAADVGLTAQARASREILAEKTTLSEAEKIALAGYDNAHRLVVTGYVSSYEKFRTARSAKLLDDSDLAALRKGAKSGGESIAAAQTPQVRGLVSTPPSTIDHAGVLTGTTAAVNRQVQACTAA